MKKLLLILPMLVAFVTYSQDIADKKELPKDKKENKVNKKIKLSGKWFVGFRHYINEETVYDANQNSSIKRAEGNKFVLKRAYITLKKNLNNVFSVRYTTDITIDKEGKDAGNVEARLKYLYLKIKPDINSRIFTGTWLEVGMVHRPWAYYEQKINTYRVEGNMFIIRNKILTSADFGITMGGNIGPKMDKKFLKEVNSSMEGKWLSYAFGVYNGGGYSGAENNQDKIFEARLSARPFANLLPQLQFSGGFNTGKGNIKEEPNYNQIQSFAAYTGKHLTLTAQYNFGEGDYKGKYVEDTDASKALTNHGYSLFGEYKIGTTPLAIWGRYDNFVLNKTAKDVETKRIMGGMSYFVSKNVRIVVDADYEQKGNIKNYIYEVNLAVKF